VPIFEPAENINELVGVIELSNEAGDFDDLFIVA
jgi:hypothetical protein